MRVALKIAYDGRAFYGHQRQPDARTVEGECLAALQAAKIFHDPKEAFFRSASRTDRGVSAVGNVIAFRSDLRPDAVVGAFNDKAKGVWAWAVASVPETFHPRLAVERWYRYHLTEDLPSAALREAAAIFVGSYDFRSFTYDPPERPIAINRVDVLREPGLTLLDFRARSFRRGMVRRIVAAVTAHARGDVTLADIRDAIGGTKKDFGTVPPEPLFLMDVCYEFRFTTILKPKVRDEWRGMEWDTELRARFLQALRDAVRTDG